MSSHRVVCRFTGNHSGVDEMCVFSLLIIHDVSEAEFPHRIHLLLTLGAKRPCRDALFLAVSKAEAESLRCSM